MNQRSITEGLSRLVRIPALHAGGHGFKSHPLHAVHVMIIHTFYKKGKQLFVKVMAQSCVNTNDQNIVLYLEKKLSISYMQDVKTTFKK